MTVFHYRLVDVEIFCRCRNRDIYKRTTSIFLKQYSMMVKGRGLLLLNVEHLCYPFIERKTNRYLFYVVLKLYFSSAYTVSQEPFVPFSSAFARRKVKIEKRGS